MSRMLEMPLRLVVCEFGASGRNITYNIDSAQLLRYHDSVRCIDRMAVACDREKRFELRKER
jgi:hypothetical protein